MLKGLVGPALLSALSRRLSSKPLVFNDPAFPQRPFEKEVDQNKTMACSILAILVKTGRTDAAEWTACGVSAMMAHGASQFDKHNGASSKDAVRPKLSYRERKAASADASQSPEWWSIAATVVSWQRKGVILSKPTSDAQALSWCADQLRQLADAAAAMCIGDCLGTHNYFGGGNKPITQSNITTITDFIIQVTQVTS